MSNCEICEAPERTVWPPSGRQPQLQKVRRSGWFGLYACPCCHTAWVESVHEPYASFKYLVLWPFSSEDFSAIADLKSGKLIGIWCDARIFKAWPYMDGEDVTDVERHRQRSCGRNPVDEPREEPDLSAFLSRDHSLKSS